MRNKVQSALLIVVCIFSFAGCSVAGKYVNTAEGKSNSYIELYSGSNENKGNGYGRYVYLKGRCLSQCTISYANGVASVHMGSNIQYKIESESISINKKAKSISFSGNTYKK